MPLNNNNEVEALARELMSSVEAGRMVPAALSCRSGFNLDVAYEVEAALQRMRESNGHKAVGRKVGYANKAMWRMLKLDTLVWAHMYEDTVHYCEHNTAALSLTHSRPLKIEPEIVFGLKQPIVSQGLDAAGALAHAEWLAFGFEIIDCPYPGWQFQPSDFVASFGLHAALVVGEKMPVSSQSIVHLVEELPRFTVRMSKNGEFVEEGSGKNSLRSPALCLAELGGAIVRRFPEQPLAAGEIISSGTLTAGHIAEKGDCWTAELAGIALPPLTVHLT